MSVREGSVTLPMSMDNRTTCALPTWLLLESRFGEGAEYWKMAQGTAWEADILRRLEQRNENECHKYLEIYGAYDRLRVENEALNKDVAKLVYEKDKLQENLDAKLTSNESSGKDSAVLAKRVDELKEKLARSEEERLIKSEKYTTVLEKNHDMEREFNNAKSTLKEMENILKDRESRCRELQDKVTDLEQKLQTLQLQSSTALERLEKTQRENDGLREKVSELQRFLQDAKDSKREAEKNAHRKELRDQVHKAEGLSDKPRTHRSSSSKDATFVRQSSRRSISEPSESPRRSSTAPAYTSVKPEIPASIWDAHDSDLTALCFSSLGNHLATGGSDKLVRVWPIGDKGNVVRDPKDRAQFTGCKASILSLQFDEQDQIILAASNDQTARVWNIADKKQLVRLKGHNDKVSAARFCERSTKVVTGSLDRTVKIWDWKKEHCICTLFAGYSCTDVLVGKNSQWATLVTGHSDKQVRFWDLRTNTPNPIGLGGKITSLDQSPEGRYLLCCCTDDTLRIIDMNQKSLYKTLNAGTFHVPVDWSRAAFSPCGQYVGAGSADGTVFIWDVHDTSKSPFKIKEHRDQVVACCWHSKGSYFASIEKNKKCILWGR